MRQSLKKGAAYSFLVLLCIKAWVMPLLYLDYELRKEFIIDNFCVNKDRPELHCDGKCYLATRLAAARQHEQQQAERDFMFELLEINTDFPEHQFVFRPSATADFTRSAFFYFSPVLPRAALTDVFHPPQRTRIS